VLQCYTYPGIYEGLTGACSSHSQQAYTVTLRRHRTLERLQSSSHVCSSNMALCRKVSDSALTQSGQESGVGSTPPHYHKSPNTCTNPKNPILKMKSFTLNSIVLLANWLIAIVACACVPDFPEKLLADSTVLRHPSIVAAFKRVGRNLTALYANITRDGLGFAIVSARRFRLVLSALTLVHRSMPRRLKACIPSVMAHSR
jgi:hypothetical protein